MLDTKIIERDHQLEAAADQTLVRLAAHRWRWTRDLTNPRRVSIRAYAAAVGRDYSTIRDQTAGYKLWREGGAPPTRLGDFIARAKLSESDALVADRFSKAHGVGLSTVRRHHHAEVRDIRDAARERVERTGVPFEEATDAVIDERAEEQAVHQRLYLNAEGKLNTLRRTAWQLTDMGDVEFSTDERDRLVALYDEVTALLDSFGVQYLDVARSETS